MKLGTAMTFFIVPMIALLSPVAYASQSQANPQPPSTQQAKGPDEQTSRNYFTDLPLLTQKGQRVRFYSDVLKDKVVLISFIYTSCKDACPIIMHRLSQVKNQLGEAFGKQVFFISMSVDPVRDTPQVLAKYARQHHAEHPGWVFLTGEKANVDRILTKLGQRAETPEAHSAMLLAGNVGTRHWTKVAPTVSVAGVAAKLQDLALESAAANAPGRSAGSKQN
ncbi:MAG: SCO family protein [Betaproteobacteria bacterium]|nr:SCO family protein [Betaproteobacteria bacterium]